MEGAARGREIPLTGRRFSFGEPVGQVFEPIEQADSQCDARGRGLLSTSPAAGECRVWALARSEDLRDLPGPIIPNQQAAVRGFRDGQWMREARGEVADRSMLART